MNGVFVALGAVCLNVVALSANAQSEYETLESNAELETQYYQELDKWMLRAYEGDRDAQFRVGVLFAGEKLDKPNAEQAVYWYTQAARQGHILAQYNLGHHLLTGNGVVKNERNAIQWWNEAAKEDHALAQFNVGRAYYLGIGVEEDHQQSRYWFSRAAQNKEEKSIEVMQQLGWDINLVNNQPIQTESIAAATPSESLFDSTNTADIALLADSTVIETAPQTTANETITPPAGDQQLTQIASTPVALYTDPTIRSVLISIVDDRTSLEVIGSTEDWVTVRSSDGFPIWIHSDYLTIDSDNASVVGNNVNARSVPIVSKGTIVGKLNSGEELSIIEKRNDWYRLTSPNSFTAWVKTEDYTRPAVVKTLTTDVNADALVFQQNQSGSAEEQATASAEEQATTSAEEQGTATVEEQGTATAEEQGLELQENTPISTLDDGSTMADINDNDWLFTQPKESYTLQLASFDEQQKVEDFLSYNNFGDDTNLHRFTADGKDITWTYFLYGNYSNRDEAEEAKVIKKQSRAWVRSFGRLQENRCLSWKTKLPTPSELNQYCIQQPE